MRVNPLKGRLGYWLRQLTPDTSEGTLEGVIAAMKDLGGGDCLCLKVADGMRWQGQNDAALPVNSVADVMAVRDLCHREGVAFLPVVVPRGLAGEAEFHGSIAAATGCLMTDIEPYDGFWDRADHSLIPVYAQYLRQAAGDAYLINQPDPREFAVPDARVIVCAQYFDAIAAQHYVGWDAGLVHWLDVDLEVKRFESLAAAYREAFVTLYGVNRIELAAEFWGRVRDKTLGACVFAFGPMDAAQLQHFAGLPRPITAAEPLEEVPVPVPPEPPTPEPVPEPPSPAPEPEPLPTPMPVPGPEDYAMARAKAWRCDVAALVLAGDINGAAQKIDELRQALQEGVGHAI